MTDLAPIDPFELHRNWFDSPGGVMTLSVEPPTAFSITSQSGKTLILSWKGDVVTITGDLPATDAAKVLLNAVGLEAIKRQDCK